MPLSPILEEANENTTPRMPFQNGIKPTKETKSYHVKFGNERAFANAMSSNFRPNAPNFVPSSNRKAARRAAKTARRRAEVAAKAAAKKNTKKSGKKRTRKNRR
jgi:hypothetical protein